ncbi:MAG TPA: Hsp20/alpha crystallin family protein [Vicinamibacteria bacterium]|nr:Hsp20/alpha crystallin family protein [Vicinamibacteria bacterium]
MTGLVRWEPFLRDFDTLAGRFNQLFNPFTPVATDPTVVQPTMTGWYPAVDIRDNGDVLTIEAELPGFKKEDIDVRVENGVLSISGERRRAEAYDGHRSEYLRSERTFGRFSRSFSLPTMVESQSIHAKYRDGILVLTLPKTEASRPRAIDVKVH